MSEHTKGSWVSHAITDEDDLDCGFWVVDLPDDPEASVRRLYFGSMESNTGRDIANAHLVAAAPDLLAALEELVQLKDIKDTAGKVTDYQQRQPVAWETARMALKRARGDA